MMRFKIDENLLVEAASVLIQAGHDAQTVFEERLAGSDDHRVHEVCQKEHGSLLTLDLDFADTRTYPPAKSAGIIVIRAGIQEKDHLVSLVASLVPLLAREELDRRLWILDETAVRIRGD